MTPQHDRPTVEDDTRTAEQLRELREFMDDRFAAINMRIDHIVGRHDFEPHPACLSCEVRRAA